MIYKNIIMFTKFSAMERWKKITYMVSIYKFLIELRPLEPFMTAYQTGPDANISLFEAAGVLEAIKSYSSLLLTILMLATADYLLYKPNLMFLTGWCCFSYFLMTNSPSLMRLEVSMVGIGAMYTYNILAFCYMYARIDDLSKFQMATAISTAAAQLGRVAGDLLGQIIVTATGERYTILPYCNILTMLIAVIWVSQFPRVEQKSNFSNVKVPNEKSLLLKTDVKNTSKYCEKEYDTNKIEERYNLVVIFFEEMWIDFKTSCSNSTVLKYSLWYILGMAAYIEVLANINVLYSYVNDKPNNHNTLLNGIAESLVTLCGAAGAYLIGKVRLDWNVYGDVFIAICSILMGVLMMSCYFYDHLYLIYLSYMSFNLLCQANLVIIITEIAKNLKSQCYSLILEFNYIGSLITVSIMTLFLIQFNFMCITIPGRFLFIGGLFLVLGIVFLFNCILQRKKKKTLY